MVVIRTCSPSDALKEAVRQAGSQSALARLLGVTQRAVWRWVHEDKPLPAKHVLIVEAATGLSRHDLRPDLYPRETSSPAPHADITGLEPAR